MATPLGVFVDNSCDWRRVLRAGDGVVMVLIINFDKRFVDKIVYGEKVCTLRKNSPKWDALPCSAVLVAGKINMFVDLGCAVRLDDYMKTLDIRDPNEFMGKFYTKDGFDSAEEMKEYIEKYTATLYGKPDVDKFFREGVYISWH